HVGRLEREEEVVPVRLVGPGQPRRVGPGGVQRGHEQRDERDDRQRHDDDEQEAAGPHLDGGGLHQLSSFPRRQHDGEHQQGEHDREGGGLADLPLEEREVVDLQTRHHRAAAGAALGGDVDDVEAAQGPDDGDEHRDAELLPDGGQGHREELADGPRAVDARGLVEGGIDLGHAGEQQQHAQAERDPRADHADGGQSGVEVAEPRTGDAAEPDRAEELLHEHGGSRQLQPQLVHELLPRAKGAAGREDVVDEQHARSRGEVGAHLDLGRAVLERVGDRRRGPRQLPRLPDRRHTDAGRDRDGSGEHETAGLDARDDVEAPRERLHDGIHHRAQGDGVGQQRRDVAEQHP
ncbi:hypothetical protein FF38_03538, partial [Lucilia cuprina]